MEEIGQKIITIGVPVLEGQFIPLRVGTPLEVVFANEISAYSFAATVLKRYDVPIPTLIIEYPEKINKIQRRRYVRVQAISPVKYYVMENEAYSPEKIGYMHDISGGGMLFQSKEALPVRTRLMLEWNLCGIEFKLSALVIRSQKEDEKTYLISVEFFDITERMRDKIIRIVFEIQREIRKKGLG
ncbi:PilZ domain-containing protein [Dehalobacter sp. DCM]|nr:PilZ domain-containing protein [Dehalobacter sp. DCM]